MSFLRNLWANRVLMQIYLPPLIFLFVPFVYATKASLCGYLLLVMISYWLTECIPTPVTGILPLIFLPLFGIARAGDLATCYMRDIMLTFVGSIAVAVMLETAGLHKRIAVKTLMIFGQQPARLLFGIMLITWFCSMWTSNTAATVLMMTILDAMLKQFEKQANKQNDASAFELATRDGNAMKYNNLNNSMSRLTVSSQVTLVRVEENGGKGYNRSSFGSDSLNASSLNITDEKRERAEDDSFSHTQKRVKTTQSVEDLKKMLGLSVCYSASCGGIATLTGTPTNLILVGQLQTSFNQTGQINFASWILCALPLSFIMIVVAWLWLQVLFLGAGAVLRSIFGCVKSIIRIITRTPTEKSEEEKAMEEEGKAALERDYKELGPFSGKEYMAALYFMLLVSLWLSREAGSNGWGELFRPGYITDTLPAFIIVLIAQCTPISFNKAATCKDGVSKPAGKIEYLISWKDVEKNTPWGFLFLVGGGFAMSDGCKLSGLTELVGNRLSFLGDLPVPALILIIIVFTTLLTGVSSNLAVCSILLPLLADMSVKLQINPLLLMFPATVACSFAFILPVSTPPNAVVFSKGYVTANDMLRCGLVMSVLSVLITTLCMYTYIDWFLHLTELPAWAKQMLDHRANASLTNSTFNATAVPLFWPTHAYANVNVTAL